MRPCQVLLPILFAIAPTLFASCSSKEKEIEKSRANKMGERLGEITRDLGVGLRDGITRDFTAPVNVDNSLEKQVRVGKVKYNTTENSVAVYVEALVDLSSKLQLRAYDSSGAEIGRVIRTVSLAKDEADYFEFRFKPRVPLSEARVLKLLAKQ